MKLKLQWFVKRKSLLQSAVNHFGHAWSANAFNDGSNSMHCTKPCNYYNIGLQNILADALQMENGSIEVLIK